MTKTASAENLKQYRESRERLEDFTWKPETIYQVTVKEIEYISDFSGRVRLVPSRGNAGSDRKEENQF